MAQPNKSGADAAPVLAFSAMPVSAHLMFLFLISLSRHLCLCLRRPTPTLHLASCASNIPFFASPSQGSGAEQKRI